MNVELRKVAEQTDQHNLVVRPKDLLELYAQIDQLTGERDQLRMSVGALAETVRRHRRLKLSLMPPYLPGSAGVSRIDYELWASEWVNGAE